MVLDSSTCRQARLARDARFDGRFFVAVTSTGIFCRPVCPAVTPAERHVRYFDTAAAAVEAGFRACLRCRPECAPGSPAWDGASTTVARALRLIGDGDIEGEGIDGLASRLGIGARHLRRLFLEHLGASPVAVLQVRRLLSAKRLIDETDLSLTTIAMAAGYGSIRRFNAAFLSSYGRSPRDLRAAGRRQGRGGSLAPAGVAPSRGSSSSPRFSFHLRYRPPYDWKAVLDFLRPRATAGIEAVDVASYTRSIQVDGEAGWFTVSPGGPNTLRLDVQGPAPSHLLRTVARVRRMFDLDADPMAIRACLGRDPLLRTLVRRRPGVRVPGSWDGFELGIRAILGQQVSVAAATTLAGRLVAAFGTPLPSGGSIQAPAAEAPCSALPAAVTHLFPSAARLAAAPVEHIGLPAARAKAIRAFAAAVADGTVSFDAGTDPIVFRERLCALPGIGAWTADYVALRALGDPDAFPSADLGLLRATGLTSARALLARAEAWRPWRAYAALLLWTKTVMGSER
jgi:AraC family transcriptional regulator, regulatory protein of adaptative response / DNA-3-methyladenine glycosylase II